MPGVVFALYFDPAELDPTTDEPAYLLGLFPTREAAANAQRSLPSASDSDPRWQVIEERLDQPTDEGVWRDGFVTMFD